MVVRRLSIVMPVLDEAPRIERALLALVSMRERGHEVIVVDGGSTDGTVDRARGLCDRVLASAPGRGRQMALGARHATGDAVVFLHADTELPAGGDLLIVEALARGAPWGRFDVCLSGGSCGLRLVERAMNLRSRLTGIATGDQAIFVRRDVLEAVGGVPEQALMEDIELSRRLLGVSRPVCLRDTVWTSSRRWEEGGMVRTILTMWALRAAYWSGVPARRLAAIYYPRRPQPRHHGRRSQDIL
ncbi:MAG: TIGR04283 family arsenosugar biosynthesis glycosyltransferase [Gammaproteobacteria bacterium]|nr:TIGR04283 family arsenosugar biosynthesis glycosyltransferase [Gammaproteobacteria bacterium]